MTPVNIVVTCASSKNGTIAPELQVRSIKHDSLRKRYEEWQSRVANADQSDAVPAVHLYKGAYWGEVRRLAAAATLGNILPIMWVASAGNGLVPITTPLVPYAATFSPCHADTVYSKYGGGNAIESIRRWWHLLGKWSGPPSLREGCAPRTLQALVNQSPFTPLMILASAPYLAAMSQQLSKARKLLADPNLLVIVSCGGRKLGVLTPNLVPADLRSRQLVNNGPMRIINVRLGQLLLREASQFPLYASSLRTFYKKRLDDLDNQRRHLRFRNRGARGPWDVKE